MLQYSDPAEFTDALLLDVPPRPEGQDAIVAANRAGLAEASR
jgi:hypothetical protein